MPIRHDPSRARDGRAHDEAGLPLAELADALVDLGAHDAINLDGGGSTTMVVHGELQGRPSDPTGERANGDALVLLPRSKGAKP